MGADAFDTLCDKLAPEDPWLKEYKFLVDYMQQYYKVGYLLHYMGADAFDTLCDKLAPEDPWLKEYKFLVDYMQQYYNPAPLEIAENFRFNKRRQQEGELYRLLETKDLTLERALEISVSMELSSRDVAQLHQKDFKVTINPVLDIDEHPLPTIAINPVLDIDEHPLPTIDELFASMEGELNFQRLISVRHIYS
ncbi:hypothetical protein QE152_g24506 [Popillia japonica]|uniref:Uncharacterized protein n=1 Tax=Popillia japonica TaxID=7064 RepID=A0AAW1KFH4_POPJA